MKRFLARVWWLPVLVGIAVLSQVPWVIRLGEMLAAHQSVGVAITSGAAAVGFVLMMGGIIASMMRESEPISHEQVEESLRRQRDAAALPYAFRRSVYRLKGDALGRGLEVETSLSGYKRAWRSGDWWRDREWRRIYVITLGVVLMTVGLFGIFIVIGPMPVKLLCAAALIYPAVRLALALRNE